MVTWDVGEIQFEVVVVASQKMAWRAFHFAWIVSSYYRGWRWLHVQSMAVLLQTKQCVLFQTQCVSLSPQSTLQIWPGLFPAGWHTYSQTHTYWVAVASDRHGLDAGLRQWNNRSAPSLNMSLEEKHQSKHSSGRLQTSKWGVQGPRSVTHL